MHSERVPGRLDFFSGATLRHRPQLWGDVDEHARTFYGISMPKSTLQPVGKHGFFPGGKHREQTHDGRRSFRSGSMVGPRSHKHAHNTVHKYSIGKMLVRALRLRHRGVRLDPSVLRAAVPLEGLLRLSVSHYEGRDGRGVMVCSLMPVAGSLQPIVELFSAKLVKIEARGILISGEEEEWKRKRRIAFPQTLWAWPIPPAARTSWPNESGSSREVMKLLEAIETLNVVAD